MPRLPRWLALSAALVAAAPASAAPAGEVIVGALAGPPKPSFIAKVRAGELGGVILVGRWTPEAMRATTAQLHAGGCTIGRPLLVLVDQEGGYARRLTWAAPVRSARELGGLGTARTFQQARATATALRAAGVDVDLAPSRTRWRLVASSAADRSAPMPRQSAVWRRRSSAGFSRPASLRPRSTSPGSGRRIGTPIATP